MRLVIALIMITLLSAGAPGQIRPGPVGTLVVSSSLDPDGMTVADAYMTAWDIPAANRLNVAWPLKKMGWFGTRVNESDIATLGKTIDAHIATNALEIDRIVLCGQMPYSYYTTAGRQSVQAYLANGGPTFTNAYYARGWGTRGTFEKTGRQVFTLYGYTVADTLNMIARAHASDASHPVGTIYLQDCGTQVQNLRWPNTLAIPGEVRALGVGCDREVTGGWYANFAPKRQDILGILTGYGLHDTPKKPLLDTGITLLPGSLADHLTSGGGRLDVWYPNEYWHMNVLEWVRWGVAMTYGCVDEPYATQTRFPNAKMYLMYANGSSIGDAYWGSVSDLLKSCFVGDPIAAPFATRPILSAAYDPETHTVTVAAKTTRAAGIQGVRVWLDDKPFGQWLAPGWQAGDRVTVTVAGRSASYVLPSASTTREQAAAGLAAAINAANLPVKALSGTEPWLMDSFTAPKVYPGSVRLVVKEEAASVPYGVSSTGRLIASTVGTQTYSQNSRPATWKVTFNEKGVLGDRVDVIFNIDGKMTTVSYTAKASYGEMYKGLAAAINACPDLQGPDGVSATLVAGYLKWYLTLTGRDAKTHSRSVIVIPHPVTPLTPRFSVTDGGPVPVTISGVAMPGDEATLHVMLYDRTVVRLTARCATSRADLGRALAEAVQGSERLGRLDGVEMVGLSVGSTAVNITLVPRNLDRPVTVGSSYYRSQPTSTLKITGSNVTPAKVSIYAAAGTDLAGYALRMQMRPSGASETPIDITVTGNPGETMASLTNRLIIAVKAQPILAGTGVTFASQALSTGRIITVTCPKAVWEVRYLLPAMTGVGMRPLVGTPLANGFTRCEDVVPVPASPVLSKQIRTLKPDGIAGLGRIWLNPGSPEFTVTFPLTASMMSPGPHRLRIATQDTSLEETWQQTVLPLTMP